MTFKKGVSGNPSGRGSPRMKLMEAIFSTFGNNLELFKEKLDEEIKKDPVKAAKEYAFPFLPKNLEISGNMGQPIPVKIEYPEGFNPK